MKKILFLVLALCAIVSSKNVKAEESSLKWERIPRQQKVTYDNGIEVHVNIDNNKVSVTLPPGWSVWFKKNNTNYKPMSINNESLEQYQQRIKNQGTDGWKQNTNPRVYIGNDIENPKVSIYNDNQGNIWLPINITLDSSFKKGDKFIVSFQNDEGFFVGSVFYKDSETLREEKQKELDDEYADKLFIQSVLDEQNKTWKDRVRDTFQDAWWNFKGWVYGPTPAASEISK
ncbi:hypothetical protein ACVRW4_04185 [Streptococcus phocae subsp. phocae]